MRRPSFSLASTTATLLTVIALVAPASPASAAAPDSSVESVTQCEIAGGDLTWGFKESFRSYISGTIANGTWEATDGATYETPSFGWSDVSGEFDPETTSGAAEFSGAVHFTGHDGLLDTVIANPTLVFAEDGTGTLLLDLSNLTMEDALAGNTDNVQTITQASFVALDLAAAPLQLGEDGTTLTATAVPTTITQEGFDAFGTYETGTAFDPISVTLTLDCPEEEAEVVATAAPTDEPVAAPRTPGGAPDASWIGWLVGIALAAALIAVVVWLVLRRRRVAAMGSADPDSADPGSVDSASTDADGEGSSR
ncbi:hypothetical protein HD600_001520 [Microbacterium ginsengiterrae]|uniref:Htaa domain-containing protein n=1 Tax=Microbacterium ginsengiterrae TaxID=546115 RepID=A0A7W9FD14_9MICO|nr:HtaA domain-containing protein [Microbacterium ginsengiterrae]MBB5743023.1 hypothetical protein [Microbacterium ginsengiterrae]